ncbi:hypothetical protein [Roseicella aquatilis]|nr:hypothetical protein [Roseicella aquatilis]
MSTIISLAIFGAGTALVIWGASLRRAMQRGVVPQARAAMPAGGACEMS